MAVNLFHRVLIGAMPYVPESVVWRFSKRYIAGNNIQDAFEVVRALNNSGCSATTMRVGTGDVHIRCHPVVVVSHALFCRQ